MSGDMEQRLRETLQPAIADELMRSWNQGVGVGLKMARDMALAIRSEAARIAEAQLVTPLNQLSSRAQVAAFDGLIAALESAEKDLPISPPT